jgi:hypothetical protein
VWLIGAGRMYVWLIGASTRGVLVVVTVSSPRSGSDLERRLTVSLSVDCVVGQVLGGGIAG